MPEPEVSPINQSIADLNTQVVGMSPSVAMGNLYQAASQATGTALLNCTNAQQHANSLAEAISATGAKFIMALAK